MYAHTLTISMWVIQPIAFSLQKTNVIIPINALTPPKFI